MFLTGCRFAVVVTFHVFHTGFFCRLVFRFCRYRCTTKQSTDALFHRHNELCRCCTDIVTIVTVLLRLAAFSLERKLCWSQLPALCIMAPKIKTKLNFLASYLSWLVAQILTMCNNHWALMPLHSLTAARHLHTQHHLAEQVCASCLSVFHEISHHFSSRC